MRCGLHREGELLFYAISEHVENAGCIQAMHNGFPPQRTFLETTRRVKKIARAIAHACA